MIFNKFNNLIACEIKSSISHSDIQCFDRKVLFYEKLHNCNVATKMVISPMIDKRANEAADYLGIKVYTSTAEVAL